jgi:two-component system cell cycle sensor histidine kinase/response regulator CckA
MNTPSPLHAGRVAAIFGASALAWIVFSDLLLNTWVGDGAQGALALAKGVLFVVATTALLFVLLRRAEWRLTRVEAERRREERRWRQALDGVGDGVWEWDVRANRVDYAPQLEHMLGYAPGELRNDRGEWQARAHPDDLAGINQELERCFRGEAEVYRSEHRLRRKDGGWVWVLDRGVVIEREAGGRPLRMIGTHFDITPRKRLEEQLATQAAQYQALFEQNPHPMWIYDEETLRIRAVNDFAITRYGYSREEFLAKTILDLRPAEDVQRLRQTIATMSDTVQSLGMWRHRLANGDLIVVEIMSHAIEWQGRRARVVVAHDVTAQQRALRAIEESEQKFRAIFERASDAIFTTDEQYRLTSSNPRGLELLGVPAGALLGHRIPDYFPERQPDGELSIEKARQLLSRVWQERVPPTEWTLRRADGTRIDAEVAVSGLSHAGHRSLVVVARDITERKRATRELQLLHAALQATPEGVIVTDAKGCIEWANAAFTRMTGYTLAEVQGGTPRLLRSGQHDHNFYRDLWTTIVRGEPWSGELQNRRKDGTLYFEHMTIAPVRNNAGEITNFVAVKEDITNERRLEQQAARSQRLESVGMLASGIAHDLNNVLTPITLAVELLRTEDLPASARARLDLVGQAAQRGAGIVKQVLTFARGVEGERTIVQPRYLLKEIAQLAEETFPRSIEIHVESGREVPTIRGDITQLHQMLLNLAVNARDAMPRGGRLSFGVHAVAVDAERARALTPFLPGNYVELTVSDTGTGMTDEVLEHLFEPFFTTKPRGKGTGLGLSTVYGIARSHGGKVEVDTALGRGTTFRILLPEAVEKAEPRTDVEAARALEGGGRRVLVVDDEEPIRILLTQMLRRHGFDPVPAADGVEALRLFQLRPTAYHAAIVDLMMPRLHGTEVIRELRATVPTLRIVYSSGFAGGDDMTEAMTEIAADEANVFLPKPFVEDELLAALREAEIAVTTPRQKKKV